ncbi:MAG TPA: patatin-like phospholipase family protein, partial [Vicinamibacteria bacterium]|nr:patatin-like phospholipase family protein [Vicinamibacteria bacterium]
MTGAGGNAHAPAPDDDQQGGYAPLPKAKRKGIGLCLSGGGFRATLFHLGALRRLNELGVLSRSDFRTVASVSGGSIMSAQLADAFTHLVLTPGQAIPREVWDRDVQAPLRAFTTKDVRTGPFLRRLLPWNLGRSGTTVEALAQRYERDLTR